MNHESLYCQHFTPCLMRKTMSRPRSIDQYMDLFMSTDRI